MIQVCWIAKRDECFEYTGNTAFMILDLGAGEEGFDIILKDWENLK